jgi:hypothetical protein
MDSYQMQSQPPMPPQPYLINSNQTREPIISIKNILILVLILLLIFSFLGINLLQIFGNIVQYITGVTSPFLSNILSVLGYTTGSALNTSADIVSNTGKTGLDIADGSVHSLGNIFITSSLPNLNNTSKVGIDSTLNISPVKLSNPNTDSSSSTIQTPISSAKSNWCLVGDYAGKRGCIEIGDQDKCLSNQVFPNQQMCLNPNFTPNA